MASAQHEDSPSPKRNRRSQSNSPPPNFRSKSSPEAETSERDFTVSSSSNLGDPTETWGFVERDFSKYISDSDKLDDGPPARYQLRADRVNLDKESNEDSKLRRFTFGHRDPRHQNRTVLLVGATGSGKSTLINALVNFMMGVEFKDRVWFEIVVEEEVRNQLDSQTSTVSVYEVFGFEGISVPYSLTIIDTPGFGDTESIENDKTIIQLLQNLFCAPNEVNTGADTLDAVGLVLKATENRLDERMVYIYNSVTSLFGKDMEKNIMALMTFSDGGKPISALQALKETNVKCARDKNNETVNFCFNNRQKETIQNKREAERAAQFAFDISEGGMKEFTEALGQCQSLSLTTTVEVMKERIRLPACIQNLEERVETIEKKQEAINRNKEELSKYEEEMKKNQNFTIKAEEVYRDKEYIQDPRGGGRATTCNNCKENCHYPGCTWAWSVSWCEVMKNGKCTSCTGKCPVEDHVKENWKYVDKIRTVTTTHKEMKAKYNENKAKREEKTSLLQDLEKEVVTLQQEKNQYLDEAFQHIQNLEKIALNVDSVFTYIHLDFLMEKMKEREDTEKVLELERLKARMDERNKTGANYLKKCVDFEKEKLKRKKKGGEGGKRKNK